MRYLFLCNNLCSNLPVAGGAERWGDVLLLQVQIAFVDRTELWPLAFIATSTLMPRRAHSVSAVLR